MLGLLYTYFGTLVQGCSFLDSTNICIYIVNLYVHYNF